MDRAYCFKQTAYRLEYAHMEEILRYVHSRYYFFPRRDEVALENIVFVSPNFMGGNGG
jgi:hypothetical protein